MKKYTITFIFGLFFFGALSAQTKQVTVEVDGLACPYCAFGLEKKFKEIRGVSHLKIDVKKGEMTFVLDDGFDLSEADIKKKVKNAGFTASSVKVEDLPVHKRSGGDFWKGATPFFAPIFKQSLKNFQK